MSVLIRRASMADAAEIARVHVDSWRGAYPGLLPAEILEGLSATARTRQWQGWLRPGQERSHTLLAERAGRVGGFSTMAIPSRDEGEAEDVGEIPALYVEPQAWGAGLGRALMGASLAEMRQGGCCSAILWMLAGNDRAARFYERGGWHHDGGRRASQYFPEAAELVELRFRREL